MSLPEDFAEQVQSRLDGYKSKHDARIKATQVSNASDTTAQQATAQAAQDRAAESAAQAEESASLAQLKDYIDQSVGS